MAWISTGAALLGEGSAGIIGKNRAGGSRGFGPHRPTGQKQFTVKRLGAGGWEVIKKYVECGLGISVVTSICLKGTEALTAINVSRYFPKRSYGVVLRQRKPLSAAATRFIDLMRRPQPGSGKPRGS